MRPRPDGRGGWCSGSGAGSGSTSGSGSGRGSGSASWSAAERAPEWFSWFIASVPPSPQGIIPQEKKRDKCRRRKAAPRWHWKQDHASERSATIIVAVDGRKASIAIRSSKKLARETSKITWHSSCSRFPHHTDIEWTTAGDHQERVKDTHYRTVPKSLEGHDKCKELPEAEGPSQPRADYYRRERRDWGTHAYTGGDLPTKPNRFPVFGPQKSVTCAGRVFSSVENSSFRMSSLLGLFVGNQRKLGWTALFGQDNSPLSLHN